MSTTSFSEFTAQLREFVLCSTSLSFESLALELFHLQFEHNHIYRNICESKQLTPETIDQWSKIPALPTAAFKELDLSSFAPSERTTVFHSSGTTGQARSRHFHSPESLEIYESSVLAWFRQSVLRTKSQANSQMLFLTPPLAQAPNSSLVYMLDTIRREYGAEDSAFYGTVEAGADWALDTERLIDRLRKSGSDSKPVFLMGTAFSFVHLLDTLGEQQLRLTLPSGSLLLETGGYKGRSRELPKSELHHLLSKRLGLPLKAIICEYGMSELSSQAYSGVSSVTCQGKEDATVEGRAESAGIPTHSKRFAPDHTLPNVAKPLECVGIPALCPPAPPDLWAAHGELLASHLFRFPPWARVQIISPETGHEVNDGETGLIRVFDLANVYSVMAVQTEDLGIKHGDGFELLGRAVLAEPRGCSLMAIEPNYS